MKRNFENIILVGGNNIDKKWFKKIKHLMNRDKDINSLIRTRKIKFFGANIYIIVVFIFTIVLWFVDLVSILNVIDYFSLVIVIFITFKLYLEIKSNKLKIRWFYDYMLNSKAPKSSLELWTPFEGNISDSHILLPAEKLCNNKVKFTFTGIPYFNIKVIDSIYLKWEVTGDEDIKFKKIFNKIKKEYEDKIFLSFADNSIFNKKEKSINLSNSVYGISFLSKYLKNMYKLIGDNELIKIETDINNNIYYRKLNRYKKFINNLPVFNKIDEKKLSDEELKTKSYFAEQIIKMSSTPEKFTFEKNDNYKITLKICDISFIDDSDKIHKNKYDDNVLRIPIKRMIANPQDIAEGIFDYNQNNLYMILGGAEQNLATLNLVNEYIWKNKDDKLVAIAENCFYNPDNYDFQIGTEQLVYGIKDTLLQRKDFPNLAELFSFDNEKSKILFIYGFSAPLTKISTLYFLYSLIENREQFIPFDKANFNDDKLYEFVYSGDYLFDSDELSEWDTKDIMNSNLHKLKDYIDGLPIRLIRRADIKGD